MSNASTPAAERSRQMGWLDWIKAVAIVWIFINHLAERIFGFPYIANPNANWPPLAERVDQLRPLAGSGIWDIPLNLFRYMGWFGDQGVQLFLIASGFGLTWGLLGRGEGALAMGRFFRRRAGRIYPIWWGAHALFIVTWILTGWGISLLDRSLLPSLIGLRITPGLFYYFCPAWWFIGLILQLYLVYPLLWNTLRSRGPGWTLLVWGGVALLIRGLGLHFFEGYLDVWQRGGIFITRLPEFVLGVSLAAWLYQDPARTDRWLRAPSVVGLAIIAYGLSLVLSLFRLGMTVAPVLQGAALFVLLYSLLRGRSETGEGVMPWIARHSYSLYLIHFVLILLLVPQDPTSLREALPGTLLVIVLTVVVALGLERMVAFMWTDAGLLRRVLAPIGLGALVVGLALGGELLVRRFDPQEVFGWGERESLEPHPSFGWRLVPSTTTHLRWEGYDYTVTANSLGFAGAEYPAERTPGTLRILTVGDAFTSAEGVDTDAAWPRLLESDLDERLTDRSVEVLNFGITGHGPEQYAAVVEHFGPVYRPDLIVIGFFVNEYQDVLATNEAFQSSIGFGRPPQEGRRSIVGRVHLERFLQLRVFEPGAEFLWGRPRQHGYFLGNIAALERNRDDQEEGRTRVQEHLARITRVGELIGAEVMLIMIPAPVQVCGADHLRYYPRYVDLTDSERFDLDLPQRTTLEVAGSLGVEALDLRPVLTSSTGRCLYQPDNMHWTEEGHRVVADFLSEVLATPGRIVGPC